MFGSGQWKKPTEPVFTGLRLFYCFGTVGIDAVIAAANPRGSTVVKKSAGDNPKESPAAAVIAVPMPPSPKESPIIMPEAMPACPGSSF